MPGRASGELYPVETDVRLCDELRTGQEVEVDMENDVLTVLDSGTQYNLKPLGEVRLRHLCMPIFLCVWGLKANMPSGRMSSRIMHGVSSHLLMTQA